MFVVLIDNCISNIFQIVDVEMPFDKQKSQRKGFCFITFDSEQVVTELLKTPKQKISGKEVDVKRATPKPESQVMRGGRGGVRGGRGGFVRGELFIYLVVYITFVNLSQFWIYSYYYI